MKHLPQVLFWAGIVSIPLSWLMWYFGPEIEKSIKEQVTVSKVGLKTNLLLP